MRWLGTARRARDVALDYTTGRKVFGSELAKLGMVQGMLADSEIDMAASRALIWHTAYQRDSGAGAAQLSSISKTFVAEAVNRVVDRAVQGLRRTWGVRGRIAGAAPA